MADVTFYHHERADNGQRTGLTVDGLRALERFIPGSEERDPTLRWYVDATCTTDETLLTQHDAFSWWATHSDVIRQSLKMAAHMLDSGIDMDSLPWRFEFPSTDGPVRLSVSAMRRFDAIDIAARIRQVNDSLESPTALSPIGEGLRTCPTV